MQTEGKNVFIEFQIIKLSNLDNLIKELDILIAGNKKIFLWSNSVSVEQMQKYCLSIIIKKTEEELDKHKKCLELRLKSKLYKEIAAEIGISTSEVSYYLNSDPERMWTLDDWISDYFPKDSSIYDKIDILIDNNQKIVDRFKNRGIESHFIQKV